MAPHETPMMPALVGGAAPQWLLEQIPVPSPGTGQVLIQVQAAGLNRADLLMLEGAYNPDATGHLTRYTAGLEMAGEVVEVGAGVAGVRQGDRVMAATLGAFARYALVDARHLVSVPEGLSWTDAAALPVGLTTEHDALVTQAGFTAGKSVLITGATSGVGMVGVQVAKALGAPLVIATTTSAAKAQAVRDAGADLVIDTSTEDVAAVVREATDGMGVDIVLDHVGGQLFGALLEATRTQGTVINIGRLGGRTATIDLDVVAFRRLRVLGTTFSIRTDEERGEVAAALRAEVLPALADGRIRPIVERVVSFGRAQDAAELMLSAGSVVGKIVVNLEEVDLVDLFVDEDRG